MTRGCIRDRRAAPIAIPDQSAGEPDLDGSGRAAVSVVSWGPGTRRGIQ